jgi:hypothetical protein
MITMYLDQMNSIQKLVSCNVVKQEKEVEVKVELTNTICLFDELFRLLGEQEREEKPPG